METIEEEEFHVPGEIKSLFYGIKKEKQWDIIESLINNENDLSYTELRENLGLGLDEKGDLNYHLNNLEESGWLRNIVKPGKDLADKHSSFYSVTKFGLKALNGSVQAMNLESYQEDPLMQLTNQNPQIGVLGWNVQPGIINPTDILRTLVKDDTMLQFRSGETQSNVNFVSSEPAPFSATSVIVPSETPSEEISLELGNERKIENELFVLAGTKKRKRE